MSLKDTTETYLNLDSDQFNSWIRDFDNKYDQVENSNFNESESNINNLILSESEKSVEIESESDSEDDYEINSNSNIFIKNNIKDESETENTESSFINNTSSANKILMFNKLKTSIKNPISNNMSSNNMSSNNMSSNNMSSNNTSPINQRTIHIKEEPSNTHKDTIHKSKQSNNSEYIERTYTSNIFSLNQLNSMIPESFTETKNRVGKQNINDEYINNANADGTKINTNKYHTQLGEVALYKFINRRRK